MVDKLERQSSEIAVMATMCEPYQLNDIHLREVSVDGHEFQEKRLYIKLQGVNNKSGETEQIHIYLNQLDSEHLGMSFQNAIKNGFFDSSNNKEAESG